MKKIFRILILLLVIFPVSTKAYYNSCTNSDTSKLNKIASNVLYNYTYYTDNTGNLKFKIIVNNLHHYLYLYDPQKKQTYYSTGEVEILNYAPDRTIELKLHSNLATCKGVYINSLFITLPPYNKYYNDKLCEGIENYKLCRRWSKMTLNYEDFKKEVIKYKKSLEIKDVQDDDYDKSIIEIILDFYFDYYFVILPPIVIVSGIVIYMIKRKQEKESFF